MKIKKFIHFVNEISGTELVGPVGPSYGETRIQNKTITDRNTKVIYSDIDDKFYTIDEYNDLYIEYLKKGGKPLNGFSQENLSILLSNL